MRTPQSHGSPEPAAGEGARVMGAPVCKGQREGVPSRGESSRAKRALVRKPTIFSFRCPSRMELGQLQGGTGLGKQTSSRGSAAARRDGLHATWKNLTSPYAAYTGPTCAWGRGLSCGRWALSGALAMPLPVAVSLTCSPWGGDGNIGLRSLCAPRARCAQPRWELDGTRASSSLTLHGGSANRTS